MNKGDQEQDRAATNEEWEIRYFSQRLGWTPKQLKEALKRAEIIPPEVRKAWRKFNG